MNDELAKTFWTSLPSLTEQLRAKYGNLARLVRVATSADPAASRNLSDSAEKQRRQAKRVDYREIGDKDDEFEAMLLNEEAQYQTTKRRRVQAMEEGLEDVYLGTSQVEQETAWAMDFSAMAIVEEEEDLIPSTGSELSYIKMRNYILSRWRGQANRYLSEEEAVEGLPGSQKAYAQVAWRFLDTSGFINFGVMQQIPEQVLKKMDSPSRNVIIIGAGMAGLAAAQLLKRKGHNVLILEGHSRPGGRVYTKKLKAGDHEAVADLGGSILTGIDGNPLAVIAKQLRIPMHEIEQTQVPIYLEDGSLPSKELDEQIEEDYNKLLDACSNFRDNLGEVADNISLGVPLQQFWEDTCAERASAVHGPYISNEDILQRLQERELRQRFFNWHTANLEFANAASVNDLSVRSWDQDDPHELPGSHCFLPGGNIRIVSAMSRGLRIMYNSRVKQIMYSKQDVAVRTAMHVFKGDAVLVTVPLGVLKHGDIKFDPPLPVRKQEAIQRIGFGLLNKIVLLFPHSFWGNRDMFGRLPELSHKRGEGYLFYSYNHISGAAVLAGLISGDAAKEFEERSLEQSTLRVMAMIRGIFEPKGITVPAPLQVCCTRWGKDELARGSYSSMAVGALGGDDYDILGESLGGRVFFAGESTNRKYPATMHGAFYSGTREAANITATFNKAAAEAQKAREQKFDVGKPEAVEPAIDTSAYQQSEAIWACLQELQKVFKDPKNPPDKEFGCFAAIVGPPGTSLESSALLQVDVGSAKGRAAKSTPAVLVSIPLADLQRLQDVDGGNEARLSFLANLQTVKLVGRSSLEDEELETLQALLEHRKSRGSENSLAKIIVSSPTSPPVLQAPILQAPPQRPIPQYEPKLNEPKLNGSVGPSKFKPLNNVQQAYHPIPSTQRQKQPLNSLPKEY